MMSAETTAVSENEELGKTDRRKNEGVEVRLTMNVIQVVFGFLPKDTLFEFQLVNKQINRKYWEYISASLVKAEFSLKDAGYHRLSMMNLSNQTLLSIVKATRQHKVLNKLASISISLLSKSGYDFFNEDLSHTCIPRADFSNSLLQYTDFSYSSLPNANFTHCFINSCDFSHSRLTDAEFGCKIIAGHLQTITSLVLSKDQRLLISAGYDKLIKIWTVPDFSLKKTLKNGHNSAITSLCLSGDNSTLISSAENIRIWDLAAETSKSLTAHSRKVTGLGISLGNGVFVSCSLDATVKIWKTETGKCKALVKLDSPATSVMMDDDGKVIVCGCKSGEVVLADCKGKVLNSNKIVGCGVQSVFIDKKYIVTGAYDGSVGLRDRGNQLIRTYKGHNGVVNCVKIFGGYIYSAGADNDCCIRKWDLITHACADVISGHSTSVNALEIFGDFVISAGQDKHIRVDKCSNQNAIAEWVECVLVTDDGNRVVAGYTNGYVRTWADAHVVEEHKCPMRVMSIAVSHENLAAGCWDMNIYIKGRVNLTLVGHNDGINSLHFIDEYLFSGASDGQVKIWLWAEALCINSLAEAGGYVHRVLATRNYAISTIGCSMTKIVIWDLQNDSHTCLFSKKGRVKAVAVSETHFAIGGSDNPTVEVFTYQGILCKTFYGHTSSVSELVFHHDFIVSCGCDKMIFVWDWANDHIIARCSGFVCSKLLVVDSGFKACENKGNSLQYYDLRLGADGLEVRLLWRTLRLFECRNSRFRAVKGLTSSEEQGLEQITDFS